MSGHTPGPWTVKNILGAGIQIWAEVNIGRDELGGVLQPIYCVEVKPSLNVGEDGKVYAMLSYEDWRQFSSTAFDEMQTANARLIAAAPDLLEACKMIADLLPKPLGATRIGEILKPVIAKAEGA